MKIISLWMAEFRYANSIVGERKNGEKNYINKNETNMDKRAKTEKLDYFSVNGEYFL